MNIILKTRDGLEFKMKNVPEHLGRIYSLAIIEYPKNFSYKEELQYVDYAPQSRDYEYKGRIIDGRKNYRWHESIRGDKQMKIKVKPEGREQMWVPEKDSLTDFIYKYNSEIIHSIRQSGYMIIGADWSKGDLLQLISKAERFALLEGDKRNHNMGHSLAIIEDNKLIIFDIGEITKDQLEVIA